MISRMNSTDLVLSGMTTEINLFALLANGYPARPTTEQAAKILGFRNHDMPILTSARLLKPLGAPAPNGPKNFALVEILLLVADRDWLNRASRIVSAHWQRKNGSQRSQPTCGPLSAKLSADRGQKSATISADTPESS